MSAHLPWFSKNAVALGAVALSVGVLAACSSSSSSSTASTPSTGSASSSASGSASGSSAPITIGASLSLTGDFSGDTVNVAMSHLTCVGGLFGGGERAAQSIFEYSVAASIFPVSAHYVALGHLHRRQTLPAHCPVHYSGSPIAVDFGEQDNASVVCLVEATPSTPARVTDIPVTSGRRLLTVRGTVAELEALASSFGEDYLRVWVREAARAGLREAVAGILPNALEVRIDPEFAAPVKAGRAEAADVMRTPGQLFADYCAAVSVADSRVAKLFADLHDEVVSADAY